MHVRTKPCAFSTKIAFDGKAANEIESMIMIELERIILQKGIMVYCMDLVII